MYYLNKIIGFLTSPEAVAMGAATVAFVLYGLRQPKAARRLLVGCVVWTCFWALPLVGRLIGAALERPFLIDGCVPAVESYPSADAIELHGGGIGYSEILASDADHHLYAELYSGADRVWMAARLWKAGKAPVIYVTGTGDSRATVSLLTDFGVPTNAIFSTDGARNTEEEVRFIAETRGMAKGRDQGQQGMIRPLKVLVVTSAWHMRRTLLLYRKYAAGVEAIPAPCDFENSLNATRPITFNDFIPNAATLMWNGVAIHEWVGFLGYRFFR